MVLLALYFGVVASLSVLQRAQRLFCSSNGSRFFVIKFCWYGLHYLRHAHTGVTISLTSALLALSSFFLFGNRDVDTIDLDLSEKYTVSFIRFLLSFERFCRNFYRNYNYFYK